MLPLINMYFVDIIPELDNMTLVTLEEGPYPAEVSALTQISYRREAFNPLNSR